MRTVLLAFVVLMTLVTSESGMQVTADRPLHVAVLEFGDSATAKLVAARLRANLHSSSELVIADVEMTSAAAKGAGYSGSLNLSVSEARNLGAAIDADFYFIGDTQTLRRSSSESPVYFESYCSLFIISSRTGQLIYWDRLAVQNSSSDVAEKQLLEKIEGVELRRSCIDKLLRSASGEREQRSVIVDTNEPLLEAPEDERAAAAKGVQLPRPYRRLRPQYPDSAARADAEATVDVLVDVGEDGEVRQAQIARWAGFGLDEVTLATVRQMHFFPARQNGAPIAMRVLLRYNFRKPQN